MSVKLRMALIVCLVFVWSVAHAEASTQPSLWERFSAKIGSGSATELMIRLWVGLRSTIGLPVTAATGEATAKYANVAHGKPYTFLTPPNYPYCTDPDDVIQLTDGRYTDGYFWMQKSTVGWQGRRPVVVTIDLGEVEPIRGISYNTAAGVAGVEWPVAIYMLTSDEGMIYRALGDLVAMSDARKAPPAEGYAVHRYWVDTLKTHGRFVQLVIDVDGFCFVDEIEVYRGEDAWTTLPPEGEPTIGGSAYFAKALVDTRITHRLSADLRDTRGLLEAAGLTREVAQPLQLELADIEKAIAQLPPADPATFRTVFPLNDVHSRIFALQGRLRQAAGRSPIQAWVCHPLDYITPSQEPPPKFPAILSVGMMSGEYRSAALNLTNSTGLPITTNLNIRDLPGGTNPDWVKVFKVVWTDTKQLKSTGMALEEVTTGSGGFSIDIPAGMTRQIWFTLHPTITSPGAYTGQVIVSWPDADLIRYPLTVRIFDMRFPAKPSLHLGGFDYTDLDTIWALTPQNRDAIVSHLKDHFVDTPCGILGTIGMGSANDYDANGSLTGILDTTRFDLWVQRWPDAGLYWIIIGAASNPLFDDPAFSMGSTKWATAIKSWITYWVKHAATKAIAPQQMVLALVDEIADNDLDPVVISWANTIHEAQPNVKIFENPCYDPPSRATPAMLAACDILCPSRLQLLAGDKSVTDFWLSQKAAGKRLNVYTAAANVPLLDPYSYARLSAWTCVDMGMEGMFFWGFIDSGQGYLAACPNPWQAYSLPSSVYTPYMLAPSSVTPGKHMEAMREGIEDYEYFVMLRDALAKAGADNPAVARAKGLLATGARRVLEAQNADKINWSDPKDRWVAETVRLEILETLTALGK